jgi:hypothetical protein
MKTDTTEISGVKKDESACQTNWRALEDAGFIPVRLQCQSYQPVQPVDGSCHTNILPTGENAKAHLAEEHGSGGGFTVVMRISDGKKSKFWRELADQKIELQDFRCDVCDAQLPLVARRISPHFKAHPGKSRQARPGGTFHMTLGFQKPEGEDTDENF